MLFATVEQLSGGPMGIRDADMLTTHQCCNASGVRAVGRKADHLGQRRSAELGQNAPGRHFHRKPQAAFHGESSRFVPSNGHGHVVRQIAPDVRRVAQFPRCAGAEIAQSWWTERNAIELASELFGGGV